VATTSDPARRMPEAIWERVQDLLPVRKRRRQEPGCKTLKWRPVLDGLFYVLRARCQRKAARRNSIRAGICTDTFKDWSCPALCSRCSGVDCWNTNSFGGSTRNGKVSTRACPRLLSGGKNTGRNATVCGKSGTKRSVLTDGWGVPIGLSVEGGKTHDMRMVEATVEDLPVDRPQPRPTAKQHLFAYKGYDYPSVRQTLRGWGYAIYIKSRDLEDAERKLLPGYRARCWVVKRTHLWLNRFRRLLVRWEKKPEHYLSMLHIANALIAVHAAGILG